MIRLRAMLQKEFNQLKRDTITLAIAIIMPVMQLLVFGFAIHTDVKHLSTVVYDQSMSTESRALLESFQSTQYFDVVSTVRGYKELNTAIDDGVAKVGIVIPPDLSGNVRSGQTTPIQVIVDASDSYTASSAIAAAQSIGNIKSKEALESRTHQVSIVPQTIYDMRIRPWYNPDFITAWFTLPGIIGIILMLTLIVITAMAIVREREVGTMEQLIVTPLKPWELMVGKILPYIIIGFIQTSIALLTAVTVFDMPIRGSILLLYTLTTLYITATLTLGIMISTFAKTQTQAIEMSIVLFMPSILLSGFMFPRMAMPEFFIWLSGLFPMTYYVEIIRGIVLRGASIWGLWHEVGALLLFIAITATLALKRMRHFTD